MALIYFSRRRPPHPVQARPVISGVVEADTPEAAKAKLATLLGKLGGLAYADDFDFIDLATVDRVDHSVIAVTIMGEH